MNAPDARCQVGTEQATIGGLVGQTGHNSETQIDRPRCEPAGLEVCPISQNNDPIECQARLGTIPVHELSDRVTVTTLGFNTGEAIEHRGSGVLEIGQFQIVFGFLRLLHQLALRFIEVTSTQEDSDHPLLNASELLGRRFGILPDWRRYIQSVV